MSNNKQSSVIWLAKELEDFGDSYQCKITWEQLDELVEQAKAMHKEEIIKSWMATDNELQRISAEKYYNETFGGNNERNLSK